MRATGNGFTGWSRLQLMAAWPLPLQCLFFFVTHDLYIYGFHRWQHNNRFLWRIHEAHHSGVDVDWLSGTRSRSTPGGRWSASKDSATRRPRR